MIRWKPSANSNLFRGLVLAHLFNEKAGVRVNDRAGFNNSGTLANFSNTTADWGVHTIGPAIVFPSATGSQRINVATNNVLSTMSSMTLLCAANCRSGGAAPASGRRAFITKSTANPPTPTNGWNWIDTSSFAEMTFIVDFSATDLEARSVIVDLNVSRVYAVTWDGGLNPATSVVFYKNAKPQVHSRDVTAGGTQNTDTTTSMVIGNSTGNAAAFFGNLGPVLIWNRALSQKEITQVTFDIYGMFRIRDNRYFAQNIAAAAPAITGANQLMMTGVGV